MNIKSYIRIAFVFVLALFVSACEEDNLGLENVGLDNFGLDQAGGFVAITSSATSAVEGGSVDVTISVPNPVGSDVAVTFSLGGAATLDTDYTVTSDDVTVSGGSGSGTIAFDITAGGADEISFTINFANDAVVETGEDVVVTLTGATATNGTQVDLGDPTTNPGGDPVVAATITVADPSLTVGLGAIVGSSVEQLEASTIKVPIAFAGGSVPGGTADVTYTLTSKNGIATEGVDYNLISDASPLTGLASNDTIRIELLPDQVIDGDTLILEITSVTSSTGVTVTLDDAADSVGIAIIDNLSTVAHASEDLTLTAPAAPVATTYLFDIGLSAEADADVTISYSLSDAVAGISLADGGSITIESGDLSGTAVISIDPSVFDGMTDLTTSLVIDDVTSASNEVSLSATAADLTRSITIDNTP